MAAEVHYFSNGTEGHIWQHNWCDRCVNDHEYAHVEPWYEPDGAGCPIICDLLLGRANPAMIEMPDGAWPRWHCMEFRRCSCDRGPDDPPGEEPEPPVHPGQGALFDGDALMPGVPREAVLDLFVDA